LAANKLKLDLNIFAASSDQSGWMVFAGM
jgi:hypothetical protein